MGDETQDDPPPAPSPPREDPVGRETSGLDAVQRARRQAEAERFGLGLVDTVVRDVFSAGLDLHAALRFVADPEAQRRITSAIDHLDRATRQIRAAVVGLHDAAHD